MIRTSLLQRTLWVLPCLLLNGALATAQPDRNYVMPMDKLLDLTGQRVTEFLDLFSNVKCVERVTQQKIRPDGKIELSEQSSYDYLVILTNSGGDLSLDESRLPIKRANVDQKKKLSMLISNGFATLFLVFHPVYSNGFEFTDAGLDTVNGHKARKVHFAHIRNMRSVAALALRGREYPLELSGTAWLDTNSGDILRIEFTVGDTLQDIGMKSLESQVTFSPVTFQKGDTTYWFPSEAVVDVQSPKQHWRNIHHFTDYKKFSVSTEEQVATK
jgi:hypothetical protein